MQDTPYWDHPVYRCLSYLRDDSFSQRIGHQTEINNENLCRNEFKKDITHVEQLCTNKSGQLYLYDPEYKKVKDTGYIAGSKLYKYFESVISAVEEVLLDIKANIEIAKLLQGSEEECRHEALQNFFRHKENMRISQRDKAILEYYDRVLSCASFFIEYAIKEFGNYIINKDIGDKFVKEINDLY